MRMVHQGFHPGKEDVLAVCVGKGEVLAPFQLVPAAGGAVLVRIPLGLAGPHKDSPRTGYVKGKGADGRTVLVELGQLAVPVVEPYPRTGGSCVRDIVHLLDLQGPGFPGRIKGKGEPGLDGRGSAADAREPLAGIVTALGDHGDPAGIDVGRRVFREYEVVAVLAVGGRLCTLEPWMVLSGMVQHIVKIDVDPLFGGLVQEVPEIGLRPVVGIDLGIVGDVVAVIGHRRMDRT